MNLESHIELLDAGISSNTTSVIFNSALTEITDTDFDGATFYFEVIFTNSDTSNQTITLEDDTGTDYVVLNLPLGTVSTTRLRSSSFSLGAGTKKYRLVLSATDSASEVIVRTARIVVVQTNATKTAIYIPLVARFLSANTDLTAFTDSTTITSYSQVSAMRYGIYKHLDSDWSTIASTEFHAVLSGLSTNIASAELWNLTDSTQSAEVAEASTTNVIELVKDTSVTLANGKSYTVRAKTNSSTARLHHAYLIHRLTGIDSSGKVSSFVRIGKRTASATSTAVHDASRFYYNADNWQSGLHSLYFEATGYESAAGTVTIDAFDTGASDTAISGAVYSGSPITFSATTAPGEVLRSGALTVQDEDRIIERSTRSSGTINVAQSFIVVQVTTPPPGGGTAVKDIIGGIIPGVR